MAFIKAQDGTELFYNDWNGTAREITGQAQSRPVVLIHGWPLDADMWSDQAVALADQGHRVIIYDRRGFGRSGQPWNGYDFDTLASDLAVLMNDLDLSNAALVGFSMGGGEVARYLSRYGPSRVAKAVLVSAVTPYMLKTGDNPHGVDRSVFDEILAGLNKDRPHFLAGFGQAFYGNTLLSKKVSDEVLQSSLQVAMMGSLRATLECAKAFATTDFRPDMAAFRMPTMIVHGTADKTVPIDSSARIAASMIPSARLVEYDGEPHGLFATAKDRLTQDLVEFIGS